MAGLTIRDRGGIRGLVRSFSDAPPSSRRTAGLALLVAAPALVAFALTLALAGSSSPLRSSLALVPGTGVSSSGIRILAVRAAPVPGLKLPPRAVRRQSSLPSRALRTSHHPSSATSHAPVVVASPTPAAALVPVTRPSVPVVSVAPTPPSRAVTVAPSHSAPATASPAPPSKPTGSGTATGSDPTPANSGTVSGGG